MADSTYEAKIRIYVDQPLTAAHLSAIGDAIDGLEAVIRDTIEDEAPDTRVFAVEAHGPEAVA